MRIRTLTLLCVVLAVGGTSWSQNKLSEVAGSITLNPAAVVEKEGFVDDDRSAEQADHDLLAGAVADCRERADAVGSLVEEARSTALSRDADLLQRMEAAALELETGVQEIYLLRLTPPFDEPAATARTAADACGAAIESIRMELDRLGAGLGQAGEHIATCRTGLARATDELAALAGDEASAAATESAPGPGVPLDDDEVVVSACAVERDRGDDALDACVERQYRALAAIESRNPANEMVDEMTFTGIREMCATRFPADFVQRDSCELDTLTAVRLETEQLPAVE